MLKKLKMYIIYYIIYSKRVDWKLPGLKKARVITRLLLGVIGAGFVIGIRMVAEWFPPKEVGEAEGIYGGFGNFGSAASAFLLPVIALNVFGGENGWRWAIVLTGVSCLIYGFIYYANVTDTPPGKEYKRPRRAGAASSRRARRTRSTTGSAYASVLPEPVSASPSTSRPASAGASVAAWIGSSASNP